MKFNKFNQLICNLYYYIIKSLNMITVIVWINVHNTVVFFECFHRADVRCPIRSRQTESLVCALVLKVFPDVENASSSACRSLFETSLSTKVESSCLPPPLKLVRVNGQQAYIPCIDIFAECQLNLWAPNVRKKILSEDFLLLFGTNWLFLYRK